MWLHHRKKKVKKKQNESSRIKPTASEVTQFGVDDVVKVNLGTNKWKTGFVVAIVPKYNSYEVKVKIDGSIFWCEIERVELIEKASANASPAEYDEHLNDNFTSHAESEYLSLTQYKDFIKKGHEPVWKTIAFVRHGKSMWNEAKEEGVWSQMKALQCGYKESRMADADDSAILDAPLSREGMRQAKSLADFLRLNKIEDALSQVKDVKNEMEWLLDNALMLLEKKTKASITDGERYVQQAIEKLRTLKVDSEIPTEKDREIKNNESISIPILCDIINHDFTNCLITSSNLRRAISTACISILKRTEISSPDEQIHILSCLQELGQNYDTMPSAPSGEIPVLSARERKASVLDSETIEKLTNSYEERLSGTENFGDARTIHKRDRFKNYLTYVFGQEREHCITFGHSHWFREFFRHTLHSYELDSSCDVKKCKLNNCACFAFRICKIVVEEDGEDNTYYFVPQETLTLVYDELVGA